jgi:PleD family two-component response regulator
MQIQEGLLYSIIDMPRTVSIDGIDETIMDFNENFLAGHPKALALLKMKGISQLNKAGLMLIEKMQESVEKTKGEFVIAEVNDTIETILKHQGVHERVPIFKTILDFEKNRGLDTSIDVLEDLPGPVSGACDPVGNRKLPTSVMLIESSLTSRNNLRSNLNKLLIVNISEAKDCSEALRMIRTGSVKIDSVIVNIAETGMQGVLFIKNLRAFPNCARSRCLLFMVNSADSGTVQEAMTAGAIGQVTGIGTENELRECLLRIG